MKEYLQEISHALSVKNLTKDDVTRLKVKLCKKHAQIDVPSDIKILTMLPVKEARRYQKILRTKPVRSSSGVSVVAVMTKPQSCPHGKCAYCPGGPKSYFGSVPQSYTGKEPATRRAIRNNYDPYLQMFNRLEQYVVSGHVPEKIEVIIMGGTFPSYERKYQEEFVTMLFMAMNEFSEMFFRPDLDLMKFKEFFLLPGELEDNKREKELHRKITLLKRKSTLEKEQKRNESSRARCVGLTIETRPDYANLPHANEMLKLGCTRVELGVQAVDDELLQRVDRGHGVKEIAEATKTLKELGFKINYHVMLGLPGSNLVRDLLNFEKLFSDARFRPDMLKIYPCMVMRGTKLEKLWKNGKYFPITTEEAASCIVKVKQMVPPYVRIMRVQRDIPTNMTLAGVDRTNLRQYVSALLKEKGLECRCIRCREIKKDVSREKILEKTITYTASGGTEYFISLEQEDRIIGFCRMRFPEGSLRREIGKKSALIRELHVYGESTELGQKGTVQHRGFGKRLLSMAEKIAIKNNKRRIVVISGVGVRDYYRKLGYHKEGPYMVKVLGK